MRPSAKFFWSLAIVLFLPLMAHAQFEYDHAFLWTQVGGMQDLGTIQGLQNSYAFGISGSGEVVGYDQTSSAIAFRWSSKAGMQRLPRGGTIDSYALAVNNSGDVAGYYDLSSTIGHAFIWTKTSGFQDLGTLGGNSSLVTGINRSGTVVGYSDTSSGIAHGFLWTQNGGMQDIGTFIPFAINDHGVLAGTQATALGQSTAAIWSNGHVTLLCPGEALAINNLGQVVGDEYTPHTTRTAFIWTPGGEGIQLLPMLPGTIASEAQGINNSGEVAGWSWPANGSILYKAFIWTTTGGIEDIGNLGGSSGAQAFAINDSGQVVGYAAIQ